jgi:hypothetical protein
MKTSELTGTALDWAVGVAIGHDMSKAVNYGSYLRIPYSPEPQHTLTFCPSTDWTIGGPIIERENISVEYGRAEFIRPWIAYKLGLPHEDNPESGPTPLIAAMRCYVASKLGDKVELPPELA